MQWQYKQWGATAVLAGHDHDYERLTIGGIPYFVNGVGGNPTLYPMGTPVAGSVFRDDTHWGAQKITATSTQMTFDFYSTDGVKRDTFTQNAPDCPHSASHVSAGHRRRRYRIREYARHLSRRRQPGREYAGQ